MTWHTYVYKIVKCAYNGTPKQNKKCTYIWLFKKTSIGMPDTTQTYMHMNVCPYTLTKRGNYTRIIKDVDKRMDSTCSINEVHRCEAFRIASLGSASSADLCLFGQDFFSSSTSLCSKLNLFSSGNSTPVAEQSLSSW